MLCGYGLTDSSQGPHKGRVEASTSQTSLIRKEDAHMRKLVMRLSPAIAVVDACLRGFIAPQSCGMQVARPAQVRIIVLLDWFSGHLTEEVAECIHSKGHLISAAQTGAIDRMESPGQWHPSDNREASRHVGEADDGTHKLDHCTFKPAGHVPRTGESGAYEGWPHGRST